MNYINVDRSLVEELYSQGRKLCNGVITVKSLEEAIDCANKGSLFTPPSFTEKDVEQYLKSRAIIEREQQKLAEFEAIFMKDAEIGLADKRYKSFEITGGRSPVLFTRSDLISLDKEKGSRVFTMLDGKPELVTKEIVYSLTPLTKSAILCIKNNEHFDVNIAELICAEENISVSAEKFLKAIGKKYDTRIKAMQSKYGITRADAYNYAYMLEGAEKAKDLEELCTLANLSVSDKDSLECLAENFMYSQKISIKVTRQDGGTE